ncbi:hypothetical protein [Pseudonocardia xishanensis]|uniref:Uncharacterized protein n=1 Tax=Pseudonocardia xishanensis TaxID=630995 RepID=A0ABP8RZM8_9PSEU
MSTHRASTTNSGGFRAVGPRPPVPPQRTGATVGDEAARAGWTPAPRQGPAHTPPRGQRPVRVGDGPALTALRTVTYVLASLASLLFIALVVYGVVAWYQLSAAFPRLVGG